MEGYDEEAGQINVRFIEVRLRFVHRPRDVY